MNNMYLRLILSIVLAIFLVQSSVSFANTEVKTSPLIVPDNDVYLLTPELHRLLKRYRAGEQFDPLPELKAELARMPHLPSTHLLVAGRYLVNVLIDNEEKRYDAITRHHFNACLERAERAKKLKKLRHAGLYYEGLCAGGLAVMDGMRANYIDARVEIGRSLDAFFQLNKERPGHHGALLVVGSYNYFTGRLGSLGKLLLSILMLPEGNRELGLQQLYKASENGTPFDVMGKMMLAPALANFEDKPDEAIALVEEAAHKLVPENPGVHLSLAFYYLMEGRLKEASKSLATSDKYQIKDALKSGVFEIRSNKIYTMLVKAVLLCIKKQDDNSLALLYQFTHPRKKIPSGVAPGAMMVVGHLFKLAGLDEKANEMYGRVRDFEKAPRMMRDEATRFMEEKNISDRMKLPLEIKDKLRSWLQDRPLPKTL